MAVTEAFLRLQFDRLDSRELWIYKDSIKVLWKKLSVIQEVVAEAEEKRISSKAVNSWVYNLRDLAYDLQDMLDDFAPQLQPSISGGEPAEYSSKSLGGKSRLVGATIPKLDSSLELKIDIMGDRLEAVVEDASFLGLIGRAGSNKFRRREASPYSTSLRDPYFLGRDNDIYAVIQLLLSCDKQGEGFSYNQESVICILGMGGIGKTTLAQIVYNDVMILSHYDLTVWANVSPDFDILSLTRNILRCIDSSAFDNYDAMDLNWLQNTLIRSLIGKRFLIILDDAWNVNYDQWYHFYLPFRTGGHHPGSKFIVTTRSEHVASSMGVTQPYHLSHLSYDDSLSLFAQHALGTVSFDAHPDLQDIGTKIVNKCAGLPLAVKTLGSLLRTKRNVDEWRDILHTEIWDFPEERSNFFPSLKMSYEQLPSNLKQCFVYCSLFPKGYLFEKDELICLWMAEGFLPQVGGSLNKQMEDTGSDYFHDLLSRSFFQPTSRGTQFMMHNLLRDLARFAARNVYLHLENNRIRSIRDLTDGRTRHISFVRDRATDVVELFQCLNQVPVDHLRTLLALASPTSQGLKFRKHKVRLSGEVLLDFVRRFNRLRVLSLKYFKISELPVPVCHLKHLRYLNLCGTDIKSLPELVCDLVHLQTLLLAECHHLMNLPQGIWNLINLHYLDIADTPKLQQIPAGIGRLKKLRKLSKFIIGKDRGLGIKELGDMSKLRGDLLISGLHHVMDDEDAKEANLKDKDGLDDISMEWSNKFDSSRNNAVDMQVLNSLQPHANLKKLMVKCYGGHVFAPWIGHPSFANMVSVNFYDCRTVRSLPSLGRLPSLRDLSIKGLHRVRTVGSEFFGDGDGCPFPCLETLRFEDMPKWVQWLSPIGARTEEVERDFPRLRVLQMVNCPKLIENLPKGMMNSSKNDASPLERLEISGCPSLTSFPADEISTPALKQLIIQGSLHLECITKKMPHFGDSIEIIDFNGFTKLRSLPEFKDSFYTKSLVQLSIANCPSLESFSDFPTKFGCFPEIQELSINNCNNLKSLPNHMQNLNYLRCLKISNCQRLVSLPEAGLPPNLTSLTILNCTNIHQSISKWGLDKLTSLLKLTIAAVGPPDMVSFPDDDYNLPASITNLFIAQLQNLEFLGDGLLNLASLKELQIMNCPSLEHLPSDGLPPTLNSVSIRGCPLLQQHCIRGEGQYWDFLAYIPCVVTDQEYP